MVTYVTVLFVMPRIYFKVLVPYKTFQFLGISFSSAYDPQGNLTAALGFTPAEQKYTLANLLLAAIDYPEDLEIHMKRTILHTEAGPALIPANRRLADAAARLQVMRLSQYNAVGDTERLCEKVMRDVLAYIKDQYHYIVIDCGLKEEILSVNALSASDYCIIPVQANL